MLGGSGIHAGKAAWLEVVGPAQGTARAGRVTPGPDEGGFFLPSPPYSPWSSGEEAESWARQGAPSGWCSCPRGLYPSW